MLGNKDEEEEEEDKVHDLVEGGGLAEGVGDELGMLHELLVKGVGVIMQDPTCGTINSDVLETKILHGARAEVEQQEVEVEKILQWRNIIPAAQRNFLNSNLSILVCFVFAFRAGSSICIPIFCWVNLVFFKVDLLLFNIWCLKLVLTQRDNF